MAQQRIGALLCLSDPMTFSHRVRMAELAIRLPLLTMHGVTPTPTPVDSRRTASIQKRCIGVLHLQLPHPRRRAARRPSHRTADHIRVVNLKSARHWVSECLAAF